MTLGRMLQPGDFAVVVGWSPGGPNKRVVIMARQEGVAQSQSGIQFQVKPALRNSSETSWIDADWFEPAL